MKKLLRYILISVTIVILFIIGCEILLRKIPNDYNYKAKYLKENGNNIEILILGSSHTFYGLNPKKFSTRTFNAAYSSQTLNLDYEIFEKNKKNLKTLNTIIIPISYFTFTTQLDDFSENKMKFYNIYWNVKTGYSDLNKNYEIFSEPIDVNYNRIKNYISKRSNDITIDEKGYIKKRFEPKWDDKENSIKAFKRHRNNMGSIKVQNVIKNHYQYMESMIKYAKDNQIRVILLTTPTTDNYKNQVIRTPQYFNVKNNFNKLSKHDNVIVADYFINNQDFDLSDFKDSDHLSAKGADKLSEKINNYLKK